MSQFTETGGLLCLATMLAAGPAAIASGPPGISDEVKANVRARVLGGESAGIVIGVQNRYGKTHYGYGEKVRGTGEKVGKSTLFEVGSITKVFTTLLLADMVERGELGLGDPVRRHLPDDVGFPSHGGTEITLQQLANHNSGLPRLPSNIEHVAPEDPYAAYTVENLYAFLAGHELMRKPGTAYEYSNLGAGLLGHVLARKAGVGYEELLLGRISGALGMVDTAITLTEAQQARMATPHRAGEPVPVWHFDALAGAGAVRSTVRDMLVFLSANMGTLTTDLAPAMQSTHQRRASTDNENRQVGLGWQILRRDGEEILWHNGGTGGSHAFCGFNPRDELAVVVLSNSATDIDDIGLHLLAPEVPLKKVEAPRNVRPARQEVDLPADLLAAFVGRYELAPGFVLDVAPEKGRLGVQLTGQPRFPVFAESETTFFYRVVDAQLVFERDAQGNVTGVVLHQGGIQQSAKRLPE